MFERFYRNRYGYSRWDGTQRIEGLDADDILKALSDDYLENGNLQQALKRLMQEGVRGENGQRAMGLREMMERMRNMRGEQLNRYNMASGVMDDLREKLEEVKRLEREGIQQRLENQSPGQQGQTSQQASSDQEEQQPQAEDQSAQEQRGQQSAPNQSGESSEAGQAGQSGQTGQEALSPAQMRKMLEMIAKRKQEYLDKLPQDIPGQIKGLSEYDFMDEQAREKFQELMEGLQQQMMQQFFQGMQQSMQNMTQEDVTKLREMIRDLNKMLRERQEGREPDFDSFMQKYGEYFPGVNSLDDLIEQMQMQQAAMQGILDNLSSEQRQELQQLMDQLVGDDRIRVDMLELAQNLEALAPMEQVRTRFPFRGNETLPLNEAMRMMGRLQQIEGLEEQFQEARRLDDIGAVDSDKVKELLGDEEYQSIEQLKELMKTLEEAGYIEKKGKRWELTARGIRKIGQKALQDIFNKLKRDGFGRHVSPFRGIGGERSDESKAYQFGDPFLLDLQKTLMNAVHRRGTGTPVALQKEDFEVYRTEFTTQSSTVLMIDMSLSMIYNGCQPAAKKVAVALESLIRSQFPRDNLYIVGFSFIAREYKPNELIEMSRYDNDRGTNMAHGLMLARQLLARHRGVNKQIIMITDGGPTVWYEERYGGWQFAFPSPYAEQQTLLEAQRCTRDGITINTFMLYDDPYMVAFVDQLTEVNHGRMFYTDRDNLGEYLLVDYLNSKRKIIS
ncbi:VWA domain-containing protein [Ktedonosporobacter rubrisoli]|uniref:VWA domain-containing protein n=1 Tax=Ktedonosporobacter rubrisoli TaxID=2509675 RepID=A0A4P6JRT2_KTERU|nr:VWA domain-containing protein [Ktedonosporobacter rubrisoli]QBD78074.1 VWA domain-containing protein [Ktedonosporobacter rubrisoli]